MSADRLKPRPPYVWLIAAYPVLFLFSQNIGEVYQTEVIASLIAALLAATLLFALIGILLRDAARAGAITALIMLAFFTFGHVHNLVEPLGVTDWVLAPLYGVIVLGGVAGSVRAKRSPALVRAAPAANLMAALLVAMTLPPIAGYFYRGLVRQAHASVEESAAEDHPRLPNSAARPDIYYIILDGYSGNEFLLHDYGYDNSAFTDALEERGFTVAYDSKTPYAITVPSKFASLNMRYITKEDEQRAEEAASDIEYLRRGIADSEVAKQLQALGYTYIFMLSGYDVASSIADTNIDFHPSGPVYFAGGEDSRTYDASQYYQHPFIPYLLETTALYPLAEEAEAVSMTVTDQPYDFRDPLRALVTWDEAETLPALPEATFAVIHLIKPHEPVAFDQDGSIVFPYATSKNSTRAELSRRFFEQLEFVNMRTLQMIDTILAESSVPPIIILQGDHGSHFGNPRSADARRTNFAILNAYHFGGRACESVTQDIIPINSFRVLFNCVFGGDYELLDPRYYILPVGYEDLFRVRRVDIDAWEAEHEGE